MQVHWKIRFLEREGGELGRTQNQYKGQEEFCNKGSLGSLQI